MATVKTYGGTTLGTEDVDETVLARQVLGRTLKEAILMYEANLRQGTHKTKERGEVRGSSKKPWRQKHTGRARAGHKRSPLWRGGGTVFGPRVRDYSYQMPKRQRRVALASALCGKLRDGEVVVAGGFPTKEPSTKAASAVLAAVGAERSALVVTSERDRVAWLSIRNIPGVDILPLSDLNARAVLLRRNVVFTPEAFDALMNREWSQKSRRGETTEAKA